MSFGDPNNPYGPPQGQPPGHPPQAPPAQPGYGYPQAPQGPQAPAGQPPYSQPQYGQPQYGQPQYGYPQAPPVPQQYGYGGGYMEMPGLMKTARVLLFVMAGFQFLAAVVFGILGAAAEQAADSTTSSDEIEGLMALGLGASVLMLALGALSIFLGVKFKTGGSGIRVTTIVYSSLLLLGGIANLLSSTAASALSGVISLAMAGVIFASMVNSQAGAWFGRPRY